MAAPRSWSVKGVSEDSRDLARLASQHAGLGIGEWIDRTIRATAGLEAPPAPRVSAAPMHRAAMPDPPPPAPAQPDTSGIARALASLEERFGCREAQLEEFVAPLAGAVGELRARLDWLETAARAPAAPARPATAAAPPPPPPAADRAANPAAAPARPSPPPAPTATPQAATPPTPPQRPAAEAPRRGPSVPLGPTAADARPAGHCRRLAAASNRP